MNPTVNKSLTIFTFVTSKILPGVALVVLTVFVIFFALNSTKSPYVANKYYATFLTNGKVYFGKITDSNASSISLTDIYYLQVDEQLQDATTANQTNPDVTLVKRGNELHEPAEQMVISNQNILFVEQLKDSSRIISAINKFNTK